MRSVSLVRSRRWLRMREVSACSCASLPGFGRQKAQIFLALLGKQCGVTPEGWREAAGAYGEDGALRSVADVVSPEMLLEVRAYKQSVKKAAKAKGEAEASGR